VTGPMRYPPGQPDVVRHNRVRCPYCRKPVDAAGSTDGRPTRPPQADDFALCFGCAEPSVYVVDDGVVSLRKPTVTEREECLASAGEVIDKLRAYLRRGWQR
jgi:hypothetical protein